MIKDTAIHNTGIVVDITITATVIMKNIFFDSHCIIKGTTITATAIINDIIIYSRCYRLGYNFYSNCYRLRYIF